MNLLDGIYGVCTVRFYYDAYVFVSVLFELHKMHIGNGNGKTLCIFTSIQYAQINIA